jgi:hypothetical protein
MTATATRHPDRPLVYVAAPDRHGRRLVEVLERAGLRAHLSTDHGPLTLDHASHDILDTARLVVCHLVAGDDLPVEAALAAVRDIPVLALVPEGVAIGGAAREVLRGAACAIVRYARTQPHEVLVDALPGDLRGVRAVPAEIVPLRATTARAGADVELSRAAA